MRALFIARRNTNSMMGKSKIRTAPLIRDKRRKDLGPDRSHCQLKTMVRPSLLSNSSQSRLQSSKRSLWLEEARQNVKHRKTTPLIVMKNFLTTPRVCKEQDKRHRLTSVTLATLATSNSQAPTVILPCPTKITSK